MDQLHSRGDYPEAIEPTISFDVVHHQTPPIGPEYVPTPEILATQVRHTLRRDLLLSFMVSQGNDSDQNKWLRFAAYYYKSTWPPEKLDHLSAAINAMDGILVRTALGSTASAAPNKDWPPIHVPKRHEQTVVSKETGSNPVSREAQFNNHWTEFRKLLTDDKPIEHNHNGIFTLPVRELATLASRLAQRDLRYQIDTTRGGGHFFDKGDPHSSLFQIHTLLCVSTSSEAYNAIFGTMRSLYDTVLANEQYLASDLTATIAINDMMTSVAKLREGWQLRHPSQEFDSNVSRSEALRRRTEPLLGPIAISSFWPL